MREPDQTDSRICLFVLFHKEQVIFHLPTELDGRDWLPMPAAECNVVVVDVPVASFNLAQQSALRTLGGAEDGIRPDIVGQHREQQRILAVATEQIEVTHQVEPKQQVTLFLGECPCRIPFAFLDLMTIADVSFHVVPALEVLDTGDGHFKLPVRVGQIPWCRPCQTHRAEA